MDKLARFLEWYAKHEAVATDAEVHTHIRDMDASDRDRLRFLMHRVSQEIEK
jgi:hypothetical protein